MGNKRQTRDMGCTPSRDRPRQGESALDYHFRVNGIAPPRGGGSSTTKASVVRRSTTQASAARSSTTKASVARSSTTTGRSSPRGGGSSPCRSRGSSPCRGHNSPRGSGGCSRDIDWTPDHGFGYDGCDNSGYGSDGSCASAASGCSGGSGG